MGALSYAPMIMSLAGGAVGAVGAKNADEANAAAANYQAQVAQNNTQIALRNAQLAGAQGAAKTGMVELQTRARQGAATAGIAANGLDVHGQGAQAVSATNRIMGEVDAATVMSNAALQAYGFQTQASNFQAEAGMDTMQADQYKAKETTDILSSLLGGASQAAGQYSSWKSGAGSSPSASLMGAGGGEGGSWQVG